MNSEPALSRTPFATCSMRCCFNRSRRCFKNCRKRRASPKAFLGTLFGLARSAA